MKRPKTFARIGALALVSALALSSCGIGFVDERRRHGVGSGTSDSAAPAAKGDGELVVGTLLPQTGDLAFLGPPEFAGVRRRRRGDQRRGRRARQAGRAQVKSRLR